MSGRGPRWGSSPVATSTGRKVAASRPPAIAHSNQAGKLAPAMLTTGSHPASPSNPMSAAGFTVPVARLQAVIVARLDSDEGRSPDQLRSGADSFVVRFSTEVVTILTHMNN